MNRKAFRASLYAVMILQAFFLKTALLPAQSFESQWNPEILKEANTALGYTSLSAEEKKLIWLTNLARQDGELFTKSILEPYLHGEKLTRYSRSLIRELAKVNDLPILYPGEDLTRVANEHAVTSGKKGTTGHQRFDKRYEPLLGPYSEVAENCAYGYEQAMDILIRLLIDEGIPDLGHRKNLLNPNFNAIGVSIQAHKNYGYNCVMSFGKKGK